MKSSIEMSVPLLLLVFLAAAVISEQVAGVRPVLVGVGAGRGPGAGGEALVGEELGPGRHAGRRREEAGLADREAAAAAVQHRGAGDTAAELEPAGGIGGLRDVVIVTVIHILYHISIKSGMQ